MDFQIDVHISAPPDIVWPIMADVERWHEWTASVRSVRLLGKGPFAVGQRALVRQPKLPPAIWTVTAIEPRRSFTWQTVGPGMRVVGHHQVDAQAGGTRATLALHYEGIIGRWLARLTRRITERYIGFEAEGLKRRSEEIERTGARPPVAKS